MEQQKLNVWFVGFPTFRYKEDVKVLARKAGLKIVDAKYQGDAPQCEKPPKLTLKKEYEPKQVAPIQPNPQI